LARDIRRVVTDNQAERRTLWNVVARWLLDGDSASSPYGIRSRKDDLEREVSYGG